MGNNKNPKQNVRPEAKQSKNAFNKYKPLVIGVAVVAIGVLGFVLLNNIKISSNPKLSSSTNTLNILKSEVSSTVKFYPYETGGVKMELLAVKGDDNSIRTSFNTCQVCFSSGRGYYVQDGKEIVCQNCGNRFDINMIGKIKNGCNPIPIAEESITDDGTNVLVDKAFLDQSKSYFENWKTL